MQLFRCFFWDGQAQTVDLHGPLYIPRARQGSGRHDQPAHYGALYCALDPVSCIAEMIQYFRGQTLTSRELRRGGRSLALFSFDFPQTLRLPDLDDPRVLAGRNWRPSRVATGRREITQGQALELFQEGHSGFLWWSSLESLWINATLFGERLPLSPSLDGTVETLRFEDGRLQQAAGRLGIQLAA